jgi:hypothetical protein
MPISFGETNDSAGAYIRVNLPQNRWTLSDGGDPALDMVKGLAIDIANVKFGWLKIAIGAARLAGMAIAITVYSEATGDGHRRQASIQAGLRRQLLVIRRHCGAVQQQQLRHGPIHCQAVQRGGEAPRVHAGLDPSRERHILDAGR